MLTVDIGNTFVKAACFKDGSISDIHYVPTETCIQEDMCLHLLPENFKSAAAETVIVSVRKAVLEIIRKETSAIYKKEPFIVDVTTDTGIENRYLSKQSLGIDRLVTASAAWHLYSIKGKPTIVADLGTATTVDLVSSQGAFVGGIIAPGIKSAQTGLLREAPELPEVKIEMIDRLIGRTTLECMSSGATPAHAAMIRGLCQMIDPGAVVVITGGMAGVVLNWFPSHFIYDEHLMMKGLGIIYARNNTA